MMSISVLTVGVGGMGVDCMDSETAPVVAVGNGAWVNISVDIISGAKTASCAEAG